MGGFINEILTGRHNDALRRLFNLRQTAPSPQISPEISPQVLVENLTDIEHRYLVGWRLMAANVSGAASAGNLSYAGLENPPGSGALIVVEEVKNCVGQTCTIKHLFGIGVAGPSGRTTVIVNSDFNRDRRGNISAARGQPDGGNNLVAFAQLAQFVLASNEIRRVESVLLPGETLVMEGLTVNSIAQADFKWRERQLETSET